MSDKEVTKIALSAVKRMSEKNICEKMLERFDIEADPEDFSKDQLIELYMDAQSKFFEDDSDASDDEENDGEVDAAAEEAHMMEDVTIKVSKEKDEPLYVDLSINGKAWRIKRGFEVTIPRYVYIALCQSVQDFYEHDPETGENTSSEQPRFNIQVLS